MALPSPSLSRGRENDFPGAGDVQRKHAPETSLDYGAVRRNNIEIRVNRTISTRHRIDIVKNESFARRKERENNLFVPGTPFGTVKGKITYDEDGNEYYEEEFFRKSSIGSTQLEQKEQCKNHHEVKASKPRSGRSFLEKILGHRKKKNEASKSTKHVPGSCDQCRSACPKHAFAGIYPQRSSSRSPPVSEFNKESLIWERLSKGEVRQLQPSSAYDAPTYDEDLQNSQRQINRADPRRKALGRSHDRKFEPVGRKHSPHRSPERVHKPPTENSHSQSTRTSDRLSIPNAHNSQSISDRNQSESLEDDLCSSRRTGRLRSGDTNASSRRLISRESPISNRRLNFRHSPSSHGAENDSRHGVIHRHVLKEFYDPKVNRNPGSSHPLLTSGFTANDSRYDVHPHFLKDSYDAKGNRTSEYHNSFPDSGYPTNTPSFRQYRRIRKDIRDQHGGQDYRSSHTSSGHRRTQDDRRRRRKSSKSHRSNKGTATRRVCANGGVPHKADEKLSTLSRYWSIERGGGAAGDSYGRVRQSLRERGQLFQDPDFPAAARSISPRAKAAVPAVVWLRPHEICARPKFIAEGATRFDVERGPHGDAWLLQAVSALTLTPKFLDRVVPPDQAFDHTYCGIFRFRFWQFGEWVEVVVDDRLPTQQGRLLYLHSTDPSEFWAALLEKAYAKMYGCYEALQEGFTTRALQDLTGGIVQSFPLSLQEKFLCHQVLNSAVPRSSLLVASIASSKDGGAALQLRNGLVTQHAYSVTGLARVRSRAGEAPLVRLRNPWGAGEWNGPWSERSWEWESLSERDKELLSVRVRNEGEFWMGFDDFIRHFSQLDVVHVGPDDWMNEPALHSKKPWRAVLARRRWRAGYNAGGGPSHADTVSHNPQFHVQIPRAGLSKCHVVVSVTQQYETAVPSSHSGSPNNTINTTINNTINTSNNGGVDKKKKSRELHPIGFAVYEIPPNLSRLTPAFVNSHAPLDVTSYSCVRETVTFFTLPPGDYLVVPHTRLPECEARFLLRVLTDEHSSIWEVNEDNMIFRAVSGAGAADDITKSPRDPRTALQRLLSKYPPELDAATLHKLLSKHWKLFLLTKPSLELAKSLVMLRDYNISGRLAAADAPPLLLMLQFWRTAYATQDRQGTGRASSYALRAALRAAGAAVSNKVLECLVLRFARGSVLTAEAFVMAMVRLHLAHERYHSIDTKMKANPLSLEEMILMTIYS